MHLNTQEILAVMGENGAGKSTFMKILAGIHQSDGGQVLLEGKRVVLDSIRQAQKNGIALIHQELNLADNLDVASNLYLGQEDHKWGWIDNSNLYNKSTELLARLNIEIDPYTRVSDLSIGQQQLIEIAKAIALDARILIMDEPTSSLTQHESDHLFTVINDLRNGGMSVIYISHRLNEVIEIADRVVVLKDGQNAGELPKDEINHDNMIRLMVGRDMNQARHRTPLSPGDTILQISNVVTPAHPTQSNSFSVCAGEVVGMAGLVGAGRTEVLETIFGITPALSGTITISDYEGTLHTPKQAIEAGIGLVPENRKLQGIILEMSIRDNLSLASMRDHHKKGFLNVEYEIENSAEQIKALSIATPDDCKEVQLLSGGNQQKVVIGKWLATHPKLLLLDEPTRGIDVGAKGEIYTLIDALAKKGVAILFVSSDMEEVLSLSDRVLVMHEGAITGELSKSELSEEAVMRLATNAAIPA
jgi:ribose transport system ATP-binding protein